MIHDRHSAIRDHHNDPGAAPLDPALRISAARDRARVREQASEIGPVSETDPERETDPESARGSGPPPGTLVTFWG